VLARLEQLAEPYLGAVRRLLEAVVVRNDSAQRERPPLCRDVFDRLPQPGLGFEQTVALATVFLRLAREANARIHVSHFLASSCLENAYESLASSRIGSNNS